MTEIRTIIFFTFIVAANMSLLFAHAVKGEFDRVFPNAALSAVGVLFVSGAVKRLKERL